jgi:hypothetical protein
VKLRLDNQIDENFQRLFAKTSAGSTIPVMSVVGSIIAQEVLKAITGKFRPIEQFLYLDAFECLGGDVAPDDVPDVFVSCSFVRSNNRFSLD